MPASERFDDDHTINLSAGRSSGGGRELKPGDIVGGSYKLKSLIGRGGMGIVFRAEHGMIGHDYALKILAPDLLDAASRQRFEREGRAIANLDHANIVKVYNMGIDRGECPYYVMDLLDGIALADRIYAGRQRLLFSEVLDIFDQIASGLAYAHSKGIIHRDVKPSNIILLQRDRSGPLVKIVDFGIAKMIDRASFAGQAQTAAGEIFGTPYYMSPEQSMGGEIDARSDIYSLGCAFYETICGRPPYAGGAAFETLMMHQTAAIPSIRDARPGDDLPESVDTLLARMMAKKPDDRYQSMNQVMHDIERMQKGKAIGKGLAGGGGRDSTASTDAIDAVGHDADNTRSGQSSMNRQAVEGFQSKHTATWIVLVLIVGGLLCVAAAGLWQLSQQSRKDAAPPAGLSLLPMAAPASKGNFEATPLPEGDLDVPGANEIVTLTTRSVNEARQVFENFGAVQSRTFVKGKAKYQELKFPPARIGMIRGRINASPPYDDEAAACGTIVIGYDPGAEFKVTASNCPAFYVPSVFSKMVNCDIRYLTIEGLGGTERDRNLPPSLAENNNPAKILAAASSWKNLGTVKLISCDVTDELLASMDKLTGIDRLEFHKCAWSASMAKPPACLNRVPELALDRIQKPEVVMACLGPKSKVKKLKLVNMDLAGAAIAGLKACPHLKRLEVTNFPELRDEQLEAITQLPDLDVVRICDMPVKRSQLEILSRAPHIDRINVDIGAFSPSLRKSLYPLPAKVELDH